MEGQFMNVSMESASDRFPQWSVNETIEFLAIRAELDRSFMETKRNKLLWDVVSSKMREKGFNRSSEQCKCKWKNLVTRYKGSETMESEGIRQFPYYEELRAIFAARMQRLLWLEAEGGASSTVARRGIQSSSEDEGSNAESEGEKAGKKKRRMKAKATDKGSSSITNNVKQILEEFKRQQQEMEVQWLQAAEAREEGRRQKEMEWRQTMEALERERIMMERRWREREEQWRLREEARAEKRDALVTALLNKIMRDNM